MSQEPKEPDAVIEARAIKRRLRIAAGNDMFKLGEIARKRAKELGVVYSNRPDVDCPGIDSMITAGRIRRAKRREKIDAYLAKRAARIPALAKSA